MRLLVDELGPRDRVAIVVYAGAEGLALASTPATERTAILSAIESLSPGGTTHGSAGIRLAYETATASFIKGGDQPRDPRDRRGLQRRRDERGRARPR